jgi:hypothetical protein
MIASQIKVTILTHGNDDLEVPSNLTSVKVKRSKHFIHIHDSWFVNSFHFLCGHSGTFAASPLKSQRKLRFSCPDWQRRRPKNPSIFIKNPSDSFRLYPFQMWKRHHSDCWNMIRFQSDRCDYLDVEPLDWVGKVMKIDCSLCEVWKLVLYRSCV